MPRNLLVGAGEGGLPAEKLCDENAQNAMRTAVTLDSTNVQAAHMLAAMSAHSDGGAGISKASPDFVVALFDDFADSFDQKLGSLGYQVPKLVGQASCTPWVVASPQPVQRRACSNELAHPPQWLRMRRRLIRLTYPRSFSGDRGAGQAAARPIPLGTRRWVRHGPCGALPPAAGR
jgi:hypothetical protein